MANIPESTCLISKCCKCFTIIEDRNYICTRCGNECQLIGDNDVAIILNKYNLAKTNSTNTVQNLNYWHDAANLSDDQTLELVNHKCPDCGSFCRFARDLNRDTIYICSNTECRHVFDKNDRRIDEEYIKMTRKNIKNEKNSKNKKINK